MSIRLHILLLLVAGWCGRATAQDYPYEIKQYDFIRYDLNRLSFPGDSSDMERFFDKLDNLMYQGKGKINVVHLGGSHVQADIVSGRLRERLQTFYPGNKGSRGLVFPFRVAGTNNPYNYVVTHTGQWTNCRNTRREEGCILGLTGMSVTTYDTTASININLKTDYYQAYDFNRVRIFHKNDSLQLGVLVGSMDTSQYRVVSDFTKGITDIYFKQHHSSVQLLFRRTDSLQRGYTLYGIQLENNDPGVTYHAIGVNGASTTSYLRCQLFEQHLAEIEPDLVLLGIGINDAAGKGFEDDYFELNYSKLIEKIRKASPGCAIVFMTNNDSFRRYKRRYYVNQNGTIVKASMFSMAAEMNLGVWDFFSIMGGLSSMAVWENNGLAKRDKVHFTTAGYKIMGDLMFNAILKSYENHMVKKYHSGK